jgi:hypothetical protein
VAPAVPVPGTIDKVTDALESALVKFTIPTMISFWNVFPVSIP